MFSLPSAREHFSNLPQSVCPVWHRVGPGIQAFHRSQRNSSSNASASSKTVKETILSKCNLLWPEVKVSSSNPHLCKSYRYELVPILWADLNNRRCQFDQWIATTDCRYICEWILCPCLHQETQWRPPSILLLHQHFSTQHYRHVSTQQNTIQSTYKWWSVWFLLMLKSKLYL
jgi:hypothetical protein